MARKRDAYLPFGNTGYVGGTMTGRFSSSIPNFSAPGHFYPRNKREHEAGNRGHPVEDPCRNCNRPFMAHTNGRCPE